MNKLKTALILLIITVPAFISILNHSYFSMHDDQHIARLYQLDQGIRQGYLYPRWVDWLGFGFGYPLFNFYPPLIYYLGEFFHILGFSYIWSIKMVFITGFILGAWGIYLLAKKYLDNISAYLASILYTFFSYHAALVYVRGALAEFFAMAVLPFVFLSLTKIADEKNLKNGLLFGISFAALILTHPLIAFPSLIFIALFFIHLFITRGDKFKFFKYSTIGFITALLLSAFFWFPSMMERKFTLVDDVFLSNQDTLFYKIHYVYPQQFIYSPWGFGGSVEGQFDGMSFALGRIYIGLFLISILFSFFYYFKKRKFDNSLKNFYFLVFLFLLSLFMTTSYASFVWDNIRYLWYLQFPWRFLTFAGVFIGICISYSIFFLRETTKISKKTAIVIIFLVSLAVYGTYSKYFKPQVLIKTTDKERTSFEEIAWRISLSSHDFSPKSLPTYITNYGNRMIDIKKDQLPLKSFEVLQGDVAVQTDKNKFADKEFTLKAKTNATFRLNTYNFPGWRAYANDKVLDIQDDNRYKLITVTIPKGRYNLSFKFEDTPVRMVGNMVSLVSLISLSVFAIIHILRNVGYR